MLILIEKIELSSERSHPFNEGYWNYVNTPKVWYRILCAVGDINNIMDPDIHALAMRCMMDTWRQLQEVRLYGCHLVTFTIVTD